MRRGAFLALLLAGSALGSTGCPQVINKAAGPTPVSSTIPVGGGTVDELVFGIIGDTRPAVVNQTDQYPTLIIQTIYDKLQNENPQPRFAVTTGDYIFASGSEAGPQLDKYLDARARYRNSVFPVMGNHECNGYTDSNCGAGNAQGVTVQYATYQDKVLAPLGLTDPWYEVRIDAKDGSWTSKFVVIAANAWNNSQATWLDTALAEPTDYTFIFRHEDGAATTAPGLGPSATIINGHPFTMLIMGHSHTYSHAANSREMIVGNGGAPITSGVQYGYVIASRRASDGAIVFQSKTYDTGSVGDTFAVNADGTPATP